MAEVRIIDGVLYMASHRVREGQDAVLGKDLVTLDQLLAAIGGVGTGAPVNARYWVSDSDPTLTNEVDISALADGVLTHTVASGVSIPASVPMVAGAVLFGGATPAAIGQAAVNLYFDSTNARLIVGNGGAYTPAPGASLTVGAGGAQIGSLAGAGNQLVLTGPTGLLARAVPNTDFAAPNAFYVVTQAGSGPTAKPPNAFDLGLLPSGVLGHTQSSGISTPVSFPVEGQGAVVFGTFGGGPAIGTDLANFQFDNTNNRLLIAAGGGYSPTPGASLTVFGDSQLYGLVSVGQFLPGAGLPLTKLYVSAGSGTVAPSSSSAVNTFLVHPQSITITGTSPSVDGSGVEFCVSRFGQLQMSRTNGAVLNACNVYIDPDPSMSGSASNLFPSALWARGTIRGERLGIGLHPDQGVLSNRMQFVLVGQGTRDCGQIGLAGGNTILSSETFNYLTVGLSSTNIAANAQPGRIYGTNFQPILLNSLASSSADSVQFGAGTDNHFATVRIGGPLTSGFFTTGSAAGLMALYVDSGMSRHAGEFTVGKLTLPSVIYAHAGVTSPTLDGYLGFWGFTVGPGQPTLTGSRSSGAALANLITLLASYGLFINFTTP